MEASHTIKVDPFTSTVTMTVSGFFDRPSLMRLVAHREEAYKALRCAPNQHVTLCDVSDCALQSQDLVAGFRQMIDGPRRRSRRLAFVVGSSLARMQIRRMIAGRDDVLCFADRQEAAAWLREPDGAARAA